MSPFEALFGFKPPILPATVDYTTSVAMVDQYLQQRQEILRLIKKELAATQNRMKQYANKSEWKFTVGDLVYLRVKSFQQKSFSLSPFSKLSPKYYGPFLIVAKAGPVAYKLQLPSNTNKHPVFHVSLLKKTIGPQDLSSTALPPIEDDNKVD